MSSHNESQDMAAPDRNPAASLCVAIDGLSLQVSPILWRGIRSIALVDAAAGAAAVFGMHEASAVGRALRDMAAALGHGEVTLSGLRSADTASQFFDGLAKTQETFGQDGRRVVVSLGGASERPDRVGGMPFDVTEGHDSSPSVGAPVGAVCDNPNPTDGDSQAGAPEPPTGAPASSEARP